MRLRSKRGWGPARIGPRLGLAPSTVSKLLNRAAMPRLVDVDLATRAELRRRVHRYEQYRPGDLVHLDLRKLVRIPDGGGWKVLGRRAGDANSQDHRDPTRPRNVHGPTNVGYAFIHTAIGDHSRLTYSEVLPDEQGPTAAAFWPRADAFLASCGIQVQAALTDNGSCYRSRTFADLPATPEVRHGQCGRILRCRAPICVIAAANAVERVSFLALSLGTSRIHTRWAAKNAVARSSKPAQVMPSSSGRSHYCPQCASCETRPDLFRQEMLIRGQRRLNPNLSGVHLVQ